VLAETDGLGEVDGLGELDGLAEVEGLGALVMLAGDDVSGRQCGF
jgi:hypothetical protein